MIIYFSATGNSQYVAEFLADSLQDELVSIADIIRLDKPAHFNSVKPFVVVAPIYAWRFPRLIVEFLARCSLSGSNMVYFVATMGSQTGKAFKELKKISLSKGWEYGGFCGVPMPDNYIKSFDTPSDDEIAKIISDAKPLILDIAQTIKSRKSLTKTDKTSFSSLKSGIVNKMFNRFVDGGKEFVVSDSCIGCSQCVENCVTKNITLVDGKPSFGNACINCYACLHRCPKCAIDIKGKTENKKRYCCPKYNRED